MHTEKFGNNVHKGPGQKDLITQHRTMLSYHRSVLKIIALEVRISCVSGGWMIGKWCVIVSWER